jgi:hypothetical protein
MRCALTLTAFALLVPSAVAGENWPRFRGPTGDGVSAAVGLPLHWSESENVVWKTPIHDHGWSSPVLWGKQIWLTTATEDGKRLFAVRVDRDSGHVTHEVKVFDDAATGTSRRAVVRGHGFRSSGTLAGPAGWRR